jgi:hypothetical protein
MYLPLFFRSQGYAPGVIIATSIYEDFRATPLRMLPYYDFKACIEK